MHLHLPRVSQFEVPKIFCIHCQELIVLSEPEAEREVSVVVQHINEVEYSDTDKQVMYSWLYNSFLFTLYYVFYCVTLIAA